MKFLDFSNAFKPREYTPKYYEELLGEAMRKECASWERASEADRFPHNTTRARNR